jgi:hypothetical protein
LPKLVPKEEDLPTSQLQKPTLEHFSPLRGVDFKNISVGQCKGIAKKEF